MQSNLAGLYFVSLTNLEISANWSPSFPTPFKAHHITQAALQEGLVPDDETLVAMAENPGFVGGDRKLEDLIQADRHVVSQHGHTALHRYWRASSEQSTRALASCTTATRRAD